MKLSICIPTYNRSQCLSECLQFLEPQTGLGDVEVLIIDNASADNTRAVAESFMRSNPRFRYHRNPKNLGYTGSQQKCFELAQGEYLAILCDDDVYLDGEVARIMEVISNGEYAFIALNYYSFLNNPLKAFRRDFAPVEDICFPRAYDILNYPSVGHFSGFVFNKALAIKALAQMQARGKNTDSEKYRGIITELAVRATSGSSLPAYFLGARKLATRIPRHIDYDFLRHLCLDYYEFYHAFFTEGLISQQDLDYRTGLVLALLPKAIIRDIAELNKADRQAVTAKLISYFGNDPRFVRESLPWLKLAENGAMRLGYRGAAWLAKTKRDVLFYTHSLIVQSTSSLGWKGR